MGIEIKGLSAPHTHAEATPPCAETVPDNTCNGNCSGCGECCLRMTLRMTNTEINKIRKYIKTHNIKPQKHFPTDIPPAVMADPPLFVDTICPFLDQNADPGHNCTIYPVRPIICKTYICSMYHDQKAAKQVFDETVANCHGEHAAYALLTSPEQNLQQLFFPAEYTPKPFDYVVVNDVYFEGYELYKGQVFLMTALYRTGKYGKREVGIASPTGTIWYPIDGLTVIKKAEKE